MPKLFVVSDQIDAVALVRALLGGRVGAARRDAAIAELRRANPALDLDRLRPGVIVTIPDGFEGAARADDPVGSAIVDLVSRAAAGTKALPAESDRAEENRRAEAEDVRALLGSPEVKRLAPGSPQLKQNLTSVAKELERQDAEAQVGRDQLARAAEEWMAELQELQKLTDR